MTDATEALARLEAAVAAARRTGRFPTEEIQEAAAALGYEVRPIEAVPVEALSGGEDRGSRPADRFPSTIEQAAEAADREAADALGASGEAASPSAAADPEHWTDTKYACWCGTIHVEQIADPRTWMERGIDDGNDADERHMRSKSAAADPECEYCGHTDRHDPPCPRYIPPPSAAADTRPVCRMTPTTKAGRALVRSLPHRVKAAEVEAIEREAAAAGLAEGKASERERIRAALAEVDPDKKGAAILAILAEPSE